VKYSLSTLLRWFGMGATPILLVFVVILSLTPPSEIVGVVSKVPFGDKGAHAIAYAAIAFCMLCGVGVNSKENTIKSTIRRNRRQLISIMVLIFIIGGIIELVQPLFLRGAEWADLIADCIGGILGISLGVVVIIGVQRWEQKRGN